MSKVNITVVGETAVVDLGIPSELISKVKQHKPEAMRILADGEDYKEVFVLDNTDNYLSANGANTWITNAKGNAVIQLDYAGIDASDRENKFADRYAVGISRLEEVIKQVIKADKEVDAFRAAFAKKINVADAE